MRARVAHPCLSRWIRVTALAAMVARPGLRAVLYHHVADHSSALIRPARGDGGADVFEAHARRLARDYQVVSLDDVLAEMPRRALLITFDDGYRSIAEVALPILRRLGLPSVFFVTDECLRRDSLPLDNLLSYLCVSVDVGRVGAALDGDGRPPERSRAPRPHRRHAVWTTPRGGTRTGRAFPISISRHSEPKAGCSSIRRISTGFNGLWLRGGEPRPRICSAVRSPTRRPPNRPGARSAARVVDWTTRSRVQLPVWQARRRDPGGRAGPGSPAARPCSSLSRDLTSREAPAGSGIGSLDGCPAWRVVPGSRSSRCFGGTGSNPRSARIASSEYERSPTAQGDCAR